MSRHWSFLLVTLLLLIAVMARLPASLMDSLLSHYSAGQLRLAQAKGTLWHGQAVLASNHGLAGLRAWRAIEWRLRLSPLSLAAVLELGEPGRRQLVLALTPSNLRLDTLALDFPVAALTAGLHNTVAKAGWRGSLSLHSPGLVCSWDQHCEGSLRAEWASAGLDIVPRRPLGDHEINFRALGQEFEITVTTLRGELQINGDGRIDAQHQVFLEATVEGDPELVDRIPNIMERNARLGDQAGKVLIHLP